MSKHPDETIRLTKHNFSDNTLKKVRDVIASGNLVQGVNVQKFEEELQKYLGADHAILVSSGTSALHIALAALNIGPGDEVIVPGFTFPATSNVVELLGAKSVFIDIKLEDYCLNVSKIESQINSKTKAIMPVHEFGMPCDIEPLTAIAKSKNIPIIEDAACAFGSKYNASYVGTFGLMGCFSFHPRKALTTGEGGLVITNSKDVASKLRLLRNHGMTPVDGRFDFVCAGFNYRLTDFQAALGLAQLSDFDSWIKRRLEIADIFDKEFAGINWFSIPKRFSNRVSVYQSYHIQCEPKVDRKRLIATLAENGIESNLGAHALSHLTYYQEKYGITPSDFPNSSKAYTHGLVLPIGPHLSNSDVERIISCIKKINL